MQFLSKKFSELTNRQVYEILKARSAVFIVEKNMRCLDMDDVDLTAQHYFLEREGRVLAYLRAFASDESVKIGRVLTTVRGKGYGKELMKFAMADSKMRFAVDNIVLHAQTDVVEFYEKCSFQVVSDIFMEENVPHVKMVCKL